MHGDKWAAVAANITMGAGVVVAGLGAYLPGERDELIWPGLVLILAALPFVIRTYARRAGARTINQGYNLAFQHMDRGLFDVPNPQHPNDTGESAESALSRG